MISSIAKIRQASGNPLVTLADEESVDYVSSQIMLVCCLYLGFQLQQRGDGARYQRALMHTNLRLDAIRRSPERKLPAGDAL
jgi:hypothetical protein